MSVENQRRRRGGAQPEGGEPAGVAMAIAAHPDDIEFLMAGTLLLLKGRGFQTHYLTLASGNCGSNDTGSQATRRIRAAEAKAAASLLGAEFHPSLVDDLEIFYEPGLLRKVCGIIRQVRPRIILTHSPADYMEDHANTSRLAVTAAFARGMPNYHAEPRGRAVDFETAIYHSMPHGLRDPLRRKTIPGIFVNTGAVQKSKLKALALHSSQQRWLDSSQGMNSYLLAMEEMSSEVGRMSGKFTHAEGWRRHLHLGLSRADTDPLAEALGDDYLLNLDYEMRLNA